MRLSGLDTTVRARWKPGYQGSDQSELCGQSAALILLEIAPKHGWQGKVLDYRNSGDTAGDKSRVVGVWGGGVLSSFERTSAAAHAPPQQNASPPLRPPEPLFLQGTTTIVELAPYNPCSISPHTHDFLNLIRNSFRNFQH
jgi:hypothetical protein